MADGKKRILIAIDVAEDDVAKVQILIDNWYQEITWGEQNKQFVSSPDWDVTISDFREDG